MANENRIKVVAWKPISPDNYFVGLREEFVNCAMSVSRLAKEAIEHGERYEQLAARDEEISRNLRWLESHAPLLEPILMEWTDPSDVKSLTKAANRLAGILQAIKSNGRSDYFGVSNRRSEFGNCFKDYQAHAARYFPLAYASLIDREFTEERANVASLERKIANTMEELEAAKGQIKELRDAVALKSVDDHKVEFQRLADGFRQQGQRWLAATIGAVVLLLGAAVVEIYWDPVNLPFHVSAGSYIAFGWPRLVVFTTLLTALYVCLRNYAAARHNEIVNQFRVTSLATFRTFTASTASPEIQNAILLKTTDAIFRSHPTGFLKNEADGDQGNQVVEIVRGFNGPKGGQG